VGLVVMLVVSRSGTEGLTFETVTATRGDLAHEVSVTGRVEPAERVTLAFETVGRVERVQATEGERVEAGQTLAALDTDMLRARRREVEADLAREQASLAELLAGARSEDVAVAEAQLAQAQAARASAERDLAEFFERSYRRALDEVRTYADQLFDDDTDEPDFGIELSAGGATYYIRADREVVLRLEELRDELNERFADWRALVRAGTTSDTAAGAQAVREHLGAVGDFLGELGGVVSAYRPRDTTEQTLYDNFKLDVLSAQSAIVALASELQRTREALEAAAAAVAVAQQERTRAARGARPESVAVAEAQVKRVEAALASVDAELDRAFLIAPLSGIVTDVAIDAGEVVSPGSGAVSLISDGAYEIVAFIPEADIAEVRVGNEAELTLDAFERSRLFSAEVVDIAPAETILDGVPTYETTLAFSDPADDIRSGMTAEIDLLTSKREDVVMIPARAIERDGSRTYVRVPREDAEEGAESFREVDVVTGVRGGGGMIEIREGLAAGETVVLFIEE
jgi:RND family efflux transporter MFP subunit